MHIAAASVARLHTTLAYTAFLSALVIGSALHYKKIVKNGVAQYPEEWFPSVSATIGDWYPERNIFQLLIALTSGPRFALVFLQYFLHRSKTSSVPTVVFLFGIIRTLSCGGWVYVTSSDDHDVHDFMMILYIVCNIPWMWAGVLATPNIAIRRKRKFVASAFFGSLVPLIYFFVQHKVYRVPGAYTRYAFFEWGLILLDVYFDSICEQEFEVAGLVLSLSSSSESSPELTTTDSTDQNNEKDIIEPTTVDKASSDTASPAVGSSTSKTNEEASLNVATKESTFRRDSVAFISDVYLSYVWWTIFTSLIPTLFYFSVWELGIGGAELALLSVLSPVFLSFPIIRDLLRTRGGQIGLQAFSLIGLLAYLVPTPLGRLLVVAPANVAAMLQQATAWSGVVTGEGDVYYRAIVTSLGVIVASVAKQANRSNNPLWPFINEKAGGLNKEGIILAILALYEVYTRPVSASTTKKGKSVTAVQPPNHILAALPLGSVLFCIHNYLHDSSTLIAWSWTGYENRLPRGPVPHLHGSFTILAMVLGVLLSSWSVLRAHDHKRPDSLSHPAYWIFGAISSYVMYTHKGWKGYSGSLGFAFFLTSITPIAFQVSANAAAGHPDTRQWALAKTYTWAMLVYCLLNLASIFTVAYAFVPGGQYLRERTDLVIIAQTLLLLPAFRFSILPVTMTWPPKAPTSTSKLRWHIRSILVALPILSLVVTVLRLQRAPPQPSKPGPRIVNTGIWTVHFGFDNVGHDSQKGMMNLIRDMELDIVGLLETDLHRTSFGHRDLSRLMVEEMNYNVDIGPGPNQHTWGAVLLSKFPIIETKHHLLPSPHGELAPAIEAVLDIYGTEVLVIVSHNGQEEDPLDRELQSTALAKIMAASTRPVIFLGYVVTHPHWPKPHPYSILVQDGKVHDIDFQDTNRWCEYIFYRGLYRTAYARLSRGIITDTELQIGQFQLPKHGHNITDDSLEARHIHVKKEVMPVDHWFTMDYYGNEKGGGKNGHFYHVFYTPLYYALPEGAVV